MNSFVHEKKKYFFLFFLSEAEWETCCLPRTVNEEQTSIVGYSTDLVEVILSN